MAKRALREKAKAIDPIVSIGKNGLSESSLKEIAKVLRARKLIKIRLHKAFLEKGDRKEAAKSLSNSLNAELIDVIGHVVVLYKR